jgi:cytochrome c oxidase subunit 2
MNGPSMLDTAGREARHVAGLWWFMFSVAVAVYVLVAALVVIGVLRRQRAAAPEEGDRTNFVWWGGIVMPIVILGVLAYLTVSTTTAVGRNSRSDLTIDVTGRDWWWDVRYPESDLRTANEIHIPVGRTVELRLRAADVIHSFWVPQLSGKVDMVPEQTNPLRIRAERTGTYLGECAEFCGLQHANMRFVVVVQTAEEYARWAETAQAPSTSAQGAALFERQTCAGCHTIRGTQADGTVGPDLTDFGTRQWIGAKTVPNTPENLLRWIRDPGSFKPGVLMPPSPLPESELRALVAYLESLR